MGFFALSVVPLSCRVFLFFRSQACGVTRLQLRSGYGGSVYLDFLSGAHERFLLSATASSISASAPQLPLRL